MVILDEFSANIMSVQLTGATLDLTPEDYFHR